MPEHKNIHEALLAVQLEAPDLPRNGTAQYGSYVTLDDLIHGIRPLLSKHNIVLTQFPHSVNNGPGLRTILTHAPSNTFTSGETELVLMRQDPQGHGAALTYMRRYALTAALGLANDADDDARSVSAPMPARSTQTTRTPGRQASNGRAPV